MIKKQKGVTLIQTALGVLVISILLVISVSQSKKILDDTLRKQELQVFFDDIYVAAKLNYFNEVNTNGSCFTTVPTATNGTTLIAIGMLDAQWSTQRFFDPVRTTVTYRSGSAIGFVDTIDIVVPLNETATQSYSQLPFFTFSDDDEVRFTRKIDFKRTAFSLLHIDTNLCNG
ncbi:type II secretion system protein [Vibrio sp. THAF190c]|jgi:hypothetical protein|uniref:type II secretion system protein n=1 Tax=Vibrio sp. THAF190c TaxID=2587865 RepID=UPI0012695383|nr:type II secretion system protein [Vibrio sp. THAF190c]QFT13399.1 hypothetical protein FIV04_25950 [Vibrio sp. THAF190c]